MGCFYTNFPQISDHLSFQIFYQHQRQSYPLLISSGGKRRTKPTKPKTQEQKQEGGKGNTRTIHFILFFLFSSVIFNIILINNIYSELFQRIKNK